MIHVRLCVGGDGNGCPFRDPPVQGCSCMNEYKLGEVTGISLSAKPLAIAGSILLLVLLSGFAIGVLNLPVGVAVLASLVAVVLHWASEIAHQLGHAWAARQTGYPMTGIQLGKWGVFSISLYPPDEPALPSAIHIRRALGGPAVSLLLTLALAVAVLALRSVGGTLWWVAVFVLLDHVVVFSLGAFLPLGFTDGSTLLEWWGKP